MLGEILLSDFCGAGVARGGPGRNLETARRPRRYPMGLFPSVFFFAFCLRARRASSAEGVDIRVPHTVIPTVIVAIPTGPRA